MKSNKNAGFTLIEMSIVLLIMGLILGGLLAALGQSTESTRRTDAKAQMKLIEEALYGYAQTYGRLPCPSTHLTQGSEGLNIPLVPPNICTADHGFVPSATLGLQGAVNQDGLLTDPWGNPYRYSVAQLMNGGNRAFTSVAGLRATFADATTITGVNMLSVCEQVACTRILANQNAPAVVLSMGANWPAYADADEISNAGNGGSLLGAYRVTNTNIFVSTTYRDDSYDDIVAWLSPNILFSKMVSSGALP
jgi:prepilin-type N-terminal cleavage/methylation domain-containing protein